ncbi:YbaB/EbfC family nucleoid-associated protein [Streptomyces seoulensis]
MEDQYEPEIQEVLAEFTRHHTELLRIQQETATLSATARSKDRVVEVTIGAQGELTALRFPGNKHQSLTGQKLAASVLEAVDRARQDVMSRATGLFDAFAASGAGFVGADLENIDLNRLLEANGLAGLTLPDADASRNSASTHRAPSDGELPGGTRG